MSEYHQLVNKEAKNLKQSRGMGRKDGGKLCNHIVTSKTEIVFKSKLSQTIIGRERQKL